METAVMQQPPNSYNDSLQSALSPMIRQLDRLEERTRDIVTRQDLESLRKELVARESLEPQLSSLRAQIMRVNEDRIEDKKDMEKRIDKLENDQLSKQDRLWMRLGQAAGITALLLALFEFMTHLKITP